MALDLSAIKIKIEADTGEANKSFEELKGSSGKMNSMFSKTTVVAGAVVAGVTAAGAAAWSAASNFSQTGDRIDKMSQKFGMSSEEFQRWESIAGHNGTTIDVIGRSIKTVTGNMESNTEAYKKLGVETKNVDGTMRSSNDVFQDTILALADMEAGTERDAAAKQLLGGQYQQLLPLINGGRDSILQQIEASEGAVAMTDEQVKSAAAFADAQQTMNEQIDKVKNSIVQYLVPAFTSMMDWISTNIPKIQAIIQPVIDFIGEVIGFVVEIIGDLVKKFIDFMTTNEDVMGGVSEVWESIKEVFSVALELIKEIVGAAIEFLQLIWENYGEAIMSYIKLVWDNMKNIFKTALDLIKDVFNVFIKIFQGDWKGAWEAVKTLFQNLWDNIKKFLADALNNLVDLVKNIGKGLFSAAKASWNMCWDAIKSVWSSLVSWFKQAINDPIGTIKNIGSSMFNAGKDMLNSVWEGCKSIWSSISGWFSEKVNWIKDKLTFWKSSKSEMETDAETFSLQAPSQEMVEGAPMARGIIDPSLYGFKSNSEPVKINREPNVVETFKEALEGLKGQINNGVVETVINIDGREFARTTTPYISRELAWATR